VNSDFSNGSSGFSLIELMIALAIAAIIASIAVPSYRSFVDRSHLRTAQADLVALSVAIENEFQRKLSYPVLAATDDLSSKVSQWRAASDSSLFSFSAVSASTGYTLTATGAGHLTGCSVSLDNNNTRTATGCPGSGGWL